MKSWAAALLLRRVADALASGRLPDADDCRLHAAAIDAAISGVPLASAFGLSGKWRGGLTAELLSEAILVACRDIPGFGKRRRDNDVARELRSRLSIYRTGTFGSDAKTGHAPEDRAALFSVLSLHDGEPPSSSRIRAVLKQHFSNCQPTAVVAGKSSSDGPAHDHSTDETQNTVRRASARG
jgi:hypothetical protein